MKLQRKEKTFTNTHIGPWFESMPETNQDIIDVKESLVTNSAIIKDFVRKKKQTKLREINEKISAMPDYIAKLECWNKLKHSTQNTSEMIHHTTKVRLKDTNKPINKVRESIKGIFSTSKYSTEKNLEILVKLAELKQNEVITKNEFNSIKKKILAEIQENRNEV